MGFILYLLLYDPQIRPRTRISYCLACFLVFIKLAELSARKFIAICTIQSVLGNLNTLPRRVLYGIVNNV